MPKDQRLYMTFPNDFWMHPKVALLSVEAKWTFVEMNGYSRMQDLDGAIPVAMAERLWARELLAELVNSHPDRPLVVRAGDLFVIRDYAEHQQTTADRDELSRKRSEAGSRGRAKQLLDKSSAIAGQLPGQIRAETETETETTTPKGVVPRKRGTRIPEPFMVSREMRDWAEERTPGVNVNTSTEKFVNYWRATTRGATKNDWPATWRNWLISDFERLTTNTKPTPEQRARQTLALATDLIGELET
jgi:hypothetical protein